jgi:predicted PhzF superfamily epimerase YddE/YHI9
MGRASRLDCAIEGDRVRVSGDVVILSEGTLHL